MEARDQITCRNKIDVITKERDVLVSCVTDKFVEFERRHNVSVSYQYSDGAGSPKLLIDLQDLLLEPHLKALDT